MIPLKTILTISSLLLSQLSIADLNDCNDIYVGSISTYKSGVVNVQFLNDPLDTSGSYDLNFDNWSPEAQKNVLSILLSAQVAKHKVAIRTDAQNACSITTTWQTITQVHARNH